MSHLSESEIQGLKNKAKNLRIDIIKMITKANSGHTGGSLSVIDLLTLLFFKEMKVNPAQPQDKERDRFVLSKGHAAPALYAVLADKGYFPKEELSHLRQLSRTRRRSRPRSGDSGVSTPPEKSFPSEPARSRTGARIHRDTRPPRRNS